MQTQFLSARSQVFHHADPHAVSEYVNQHVGSHSIRLPNRDHLKASLEHRKFAVMDICQISYGGSVQVTTTSLDTIYQLQILQSGHCHWTGREGEHLFVPGELMVINPDEPVVLTYSKDCKKLIFKLPVGLLEEGCRENNWQPPETGIRFASSCHDLKALGGFSDLVRLLCAEAENPLLQPKLQEYYASILTGKLLGLLGHNGKTILSSDCAASFDVLMAFIDDHLRQEITIEQMVRVAGVSERSLYNLFERHMASSPQHYIRQRKLERVRTLLSDPASHVRNVTEAALDYGFLNPGRFAQAYHQRFGELPSHTFRRYRKVLQ
jgi:AraC-like DNA-binding protein